MKIRTNYISALSAKKLRINSLGRSFGLLSLLNQLTQIVKTVEQQTGNRVKRIVCDNASEFMDENSDLGKLIKETGIQLIPSDNYTSNENLKAENTHKMRSEIEQFEFMLNSQNPFGQKQIRW